jgi:hypothetical protein
MRGQHEYNETCQCYRCKGTRNNPHHRAAITRKRNAERRASREEQNERYIDCGPAAWDDRD